MHRCLAFVFFLLISFGTVGQRNLDSMLMKLSTHPLDTNRVLLLVDLSLKFYNVNIDSVNYFANEALTLSGKLKYRRGVSWSYLRLGYVDLIHGDVPAAIADFERSISIADSLKDYAIASRALNNIGSCMIGLEEYNTAASYFKRALDYHKHLPDKGISTTLKMNLAQAYLQSKDLKDAEFYLQQVLSEGEKNPGYARLLNLFGIWHLENKRYSESDSLLNLAWDKIKTRSDLLIKADNRYYMAKAKLGKGDIASAYSHAMEALSYVQSLESTPRLEGIYKVLSAIEIKRNRGLSSLDFLMKAEAIRDSLQLSHAKNSAILFEQRELEKQIEITESERALQVVQQRNQRTIFFGSVLILGIVIVGLIYYVFEKKRSNKMLRVLNKELVQRDKYLQAANEELTVQKEMIADRNEKLTEINLAKDKLFSIIGHDLKGPLNSFSGFSRLLLDHTDSLTIDDIKRISKDLDKSLQNLNRLLENLLEWSRSQIGMIDFNAEVCDIHELLCENQQLLQDQARAKNITLKNESTIPVLVLVHPHSINTVIRNLISNAIKFTPEGGTVTLCIDRLGDKVRLLVTDTGQGINDTTMLSLFRISKEHIMQGTAKEKGTGLGLVLCKDFVTKNGGEIGVQSEPGKGSTFYFTMPAVG